MVGVLADQDMSEEAVTRTVRDDHLEFRWNDALLLAFVIAPKTLETRIWPAQ